MVLDPDLTIGLRYYLTFLAFGLVEGRDLVKHSKKIYLIIMKLLCHTQRWAINRYLEGQRQPEINLAPNL